MGNNNIHISGGSVQGNVISGAANNVSNVASVNYLDQDSLSEIVVELNDLIDECIDVEGRALTEAEEIAVAGKVVGQISSRSKLIKRLKNAGQEAIATGVEKSIEKLHSSIALNMLISAIKGFAQGG
ncbi:MAG: hypothetical protein ACFCA4_02165 [Cyanophyceae cyanobacterium]